MGLLFQSFFQFWALFEIILLLMAPYGFVCDRIFLPSYPTIGNNAKVLL